MCLENIQVDLLLVAQHVRANRASYETADGTQSAATKLVPQESAASTSDEGRT